MNPLDLAARAGNTFDRLGVEWVLGGSLASSLSGEPRSTMDVDLAVLVGGTGADQIVAAFSETFYVDLESVRYALENQDSLNLIEPGSGYKIAVFVLGDDVLDRRQIARRLWLSDLALWVTTPEDIVLRKLWWFDRGNRVSERQWNDIIGIIRTQDAALDRSDIERVAAAIGLADLSRRAFDDARSE